MSNIDFSRTLCPLIQRPSPPRLISYHFHQIDTLLRYISSKNLTRERALCSLLAMVYKEKSSLTLTLCQATPQI